MATNREFSVLAILHRNRRVVWARRYTSISNAYKRAVELAIQTGEPGDVVEFSRIGLGQIGTVKLHVLGKLTCEWTHEARVMDWTPLRRVK